MSLLGEMVTAQGEMLADYHIRCVSSNATTNSAMLDLLVGMIAVPVTVSVRVASASISAVDHVYAS